MSVIRSILVGAVLATCFVGPLYAQAQQKELTPMQLEEQQKAKDNIALDRQYKSTLQRTRGGGTAPEAKSTDPWANMRGDDSSKAKR
jgi:hypothetical protein